MNLKIYLLGASAVLSGLHSAAQSSQEAIKTLHGVIQPPVIQQNAKINYSTFTAKNTIFSNEFDVSEEWILINEGGQGTWAIVNETSPNVEEYMGAMQSATADNGF